MRRAVKRPTHVLTFPFLLCFAVAAPAADAGSTAAEKTDEPSAGNAAAPADTDELIRTGVAQLLEMQEADGAWPYEGVYRVRGEIPVGYRIGGTSIVGTALLYAGDRNDDDLQKALDRGIQLVLRELEDPRMKPSRDNRYDVRVWGHCYALDFFCRLRTAGRMGAHARAIDSWIPKLAEALVFEQLPDGGWNYANRRRHASFVTAPVLQALLLAKSQDENVPDEVLARGAQALRRSRLKNGAFTYSGFVPSDTKRDGSRVLPGAIARAPIGEVTLSLLGQGDPHDVARALDAFHQHWEQLEIRRKQTGTHAPPYGVAPYYFYYGHRYAGQAVQSLPGAKRDEQLRRLINTILRTRDDDGTWNDRIFPRSANYGTACCVLALLQDKAPLPPRYKVDLSKATSRPADGE